MAFLIKNLFPKARKLILKLEKISTQDFNISQCLIVRVDWMFLYLTFVYRLSTWFIFYR